MNRAIVTVIGLALLQGCGSYRDGPILTKTQFESGVTVTIQAYIEGDVTHPIFLKAIAADGSEVESAPFLYLVPSDVEARNVPVEIKEAGNYISLNRATRGVTVQAYSARRRGVRVQRVLASVFPGCLGLGKGILAHQNDGMTVQSDAQ